MKVTIDWERSQRVLTRLLTAYRNCEYPYNLPEAQPPQRGNLPENLALGTREHALFLFCACYGMRGGVKSSVFFRGLRRLYEANPLAVPTGGFPVVVAQLTPGHG